MPRGKGMKSRRRDPVGDEFRARSIPDKPSHEDNGGNEEIAKKEG